MAGMREETKTLAGKDFTVRTLPFGKGREMLLRVMQVAAPLVGGSRSGVEGLFAALGGNLNNADVNYVAETLGGVTSVKTPDGIVLKLDKEGIRDGVFDGDYLTFFEWIAFGLEVQYRDFFVGLVNRLGQSGAEAKSP